MSAEKNQSEAEQVLEYMGYKVPEIESALDPKLTTPNWMDFVAGFTKHNEAAHRTNPPETFRYAEHERGLLNLYNTGVPAGAPALIFFHGGGFKLLSKDDMAFAAPAFNAAGIAYISPGYPLAPGVSLAQLLSHAQRAAKWIYENAQALGIDRERIYVGGASAGGYVSAHLLTTDWTEFGLPRSIFKGGMPFNSVFDAKPFYLSPAWSYLGIRAEEVEALSPIRHLANLASRIFVACAEVEPPLVHAGSQELSAAARERDLLAYSYVAPSHNHFTMVLDLIDPRSRLFRTMADMITEA